MSGLSKDTSSTRRTRKNDGKGRKEEGGEKGERESKVRECI